MRNYGICSNRRTIIILIGDYQLCFPMEAFFIPSLYCYLSSDFQGLEVCVSGESTALTRHLVYFLNASQRHHCWRHLLLNSSISSSFQVLSTQSFFQFDTNTIHNDFYLNYCTYKHLKTIKSTPTPFQTLESTIPNHTLYRPHNLHSKIHANLWATDLHLNTYAIKSESAKSSYDQHSP